MTKSLTAALLLGALASIAQPRWIAGPFIAGVGRYGLLAAISRALAS